MILSLFYGAGLRMNELRNIRLCDMDSKSFQIKVVAGKGRFTLMPQTPSGPTQELLQAGQARSLFI